MTDVLRRYAIAVVAVTVAAAVRLALDPFLGPQVPFLTFFLAVMISAWVGGLGPGLLASFLSAGAANYLITQPYFEFSLGSGDVVALALFVIETSAITVYSERWKETEGALRHAVRREKDLVDRVLQDLEIAVALVRGEDLRFVLVNAAYQAISPGKTMLGKTVSEVWPETDPPFEQRCRHVLDTGMPYRAIDQRVVISRTTGGTPEAGFFTWSMRRVPLPGSEGWGLLVSAYETTDRKQTEEALRKSEQRYRDLFTSIDEGFCVIQMVFNDDRKPIDYRFLEVNPAFTGLTGLHDVIGKRVTELLPQHEQDWFDIYGTVAETGEPIRFEQAAGSLHRWFDVYAFRVGEPEEQKVAMLFTDITERKHSQQALADSAAELKALNNEFEHRVEERTRALVASQRQLRAFATQLNLSEQRERKRLAIELHDHLQQRLALAKIRIGQTKQLSKANTRALALVQEVDRVLGDALDYSRTLVAELSPIVLREHGLVAGITWLGEYMRPRGLQVHVTVPSSDQVRLPEDQAVLLFQCVRELLLNIVKHASVAEAAVALSVLPEGTALRIEVRDEGNGFVPPSVETPNPEPTKFGLLSIHERMHALGGSLTIESVIGEGTTAILGLPFRPDPLDVSDM